jgi:hypothetical protein
LGGVPHLVGIGAANTEFKGTGGGSGWGTDALEPHDELDPHAFDPIVAPDDDRDADHYGGPDDDDDGCLVMSTGASGHHIVGQHPAPLHSPAGDAAARHPDATDADLFPPQQQQARGGRRCDTGADDSGDGWVEQLLNDCTTATAGGSGSGANDVDEVPSHPVGVSTVPAVAADAAAATTAVQEEESADAVPAAAVSTSPAAGSEADADGTDGAAAETSSQQKSATVLPVEELRKNAYRDPMSAEKEEEDSVLQGDAEEEW